MRFGKNVLSQNLRTNCDLALYLTLFQPSEMEPAGLPTALDARPGTRSLEDAGKEQERRVCDQLQTAFQGRCIGIPPTGTAKVWDDEPLAAQLNRITEAPAVLIQPKLALDRRQLEATLLRLGVSAADIKLIPDFTGFVPDILLVDRGGTSKARLAPNGDRVPIDIDESRLALSVIDVKHAQEPNPSYESEAVLYAVLLANWLHENHREDHFFVSTDVALWTRGGSARGALQGAIEEHTTDPSALLSAIRTELDFVNLPIYVQAIRRFFSERIPEVLRVGSRDWKELQWHVAPSCASCDWLGFEGWLSQRDRTRIAAAPTHYCFPRAAATDHVSQLPLITRGSRRVLQNSGIWTVAELARTSGDEAVYTQHSRLQSDRRAIPGFAQAIASRSTATDEIRTDGMIARYADLDLYLAINFDPGAGILTGIGLQAAFLQHYPFGQNPEDRRRRRWRERWVVAAKTHEAERSAVLAFLNQVASIFEHVSDTDQERGGPHAAKTRTQILFWDRRQFQELCLALGRHLPAILYDRTDRLIRALAWVFPPDELQELDTIDDRRPAIAFVKDSLKRLVRVPALHALTLFNVARHYHFGDGPPIPDQFYREPLSDTIPRERIYELWSLTAAGGEGVVRWGSTIRTYNQLIEDFSKTVDLQVSALTSIVWKLREDFGPRLRAQAPRVKLVAPNWAAAVAHDSKLWIAWARFESAYGNAAAFAKFMSDAEEIEATSEGIRLTQLLEVQPSGSMTFEVSPESLNTKLRVSSGYLALAVDAIPGFLALPARVAFSPESVPTAFVQFSNLAMHNLFGAALEAFDPVSRTATIALSDFYGARAADKLRLREEVMHRLAQEFAGSLTLMPSLGPETTVRRLERILSAVGNPPIALPARETLKALGAANRRIRPGTDSVTPIARVLWDGVALHAECARPADAVERIARQARDVAGLNDSQVDAVKLGAARRLAVIWGPPGTGKTKTCAALVHGLTRYETEAREGAPYAMLLSGPTYKAVGELVERLMISLVGDPAANCRVYLLYSSRRADRFPLPDQIPERLQVRQAISERDDPAFQELCADLENRAGVIIVATITHQCARLAEQLAWRHGLDNSSMLWPVFDFVLIDETSQVDITTGVMPLALLRDGGQTVVAGDHLQMPPIVETEPPLGAEFLVGSLQKYLTTRFDLAHAPLLQNYRSNHEVVAYIKRLGYPRDLEASNPETAIALVREPSELRDELRATGLPWSEAWPRVLDPSRPMVGMTYPDGTAGQANQFEATCVASIVWLLRYCSSSSLSGRPDSPPTHSAWDDESFWRHGVGVVTPHRAQRAQVLRALVEAFPLSDPRLIDEAVDTVERFQGGERHTIIISFGVGDPDVIRGEERFLLQLERTNVAISRAMGKCIVFLSDEVANHIPEDRRAAATAHALRGVIDEWCTVRSTASVDVNGTTRTLTVRWRAR